MSEFDPARYRAGHLPAGIVEPFTLTCAKVNERMQAQGLLRGHFEPLGQPITMLMRQDAIPGYECPTDRTGPSDGRVVVMSDSVIEIMESRWVWDHARGRVLINGLGLGITVRMALDRPGVERVDVVELRPEVVELVAHTIQDPRLHIHLGDAYTHLWPPFARWDVAWHDIWDIGDGEETREGVARLEHRYAPHVGEQASWPTFVRLIPVAEAADVFREAIA